MKNLIYSLYCPINKCPVYIGLTTKGIDRPFIHIEEKSHSVKVNEWVRGLHKQGKEPIVVILEHVLDKELLFAKEAFWLNYYISKGFVLLNQIGVNSNYLDSLEFNELNINDPLVDIRNYIKIRRKLLKLTQLELSKKSGVGLRLIRELEQGQKTNFNTGSIIKILRLLGRGYLGVKTE